MGVNVYEDLHHQHGVGEKGTGFCQVLCAAVTLGAPARTKAQGFDPFLVRILGDSLFYLSASQGRVLPSTPGVISTLSTFPMTAVSPREGLVN